MKRVALCIASDAEQANHIVEDLQREGISRQDISVLYSDKEGKAQSLFGDRSTTIKTQAAEGAAAGYAAGGLIGGAIGLLAGLGTITIPGVGPFIAAGPLIAALSGSAVGGGVGYITGSLIGAGVPQTAADQIAQEVESGHVLVAVEAESKDRIDAATHVFETDGASAITTASNVPNIGRATTA